MGKSIKLIIATFILINSCNSQDRMIDKTVVKEINIERYLGTWYEIARFDHSFERDSVGVTATYSFRDDGKIKVVNAGYKYSLNGEKLEAIGKAKIPNRAIQSKLKVSFFWFFYGDYFVLELDKDNNWAVIGSSSDKYLWILSRTPQISNELYNQILNGLNERGYDVRQLIQVKQKT